MATGTKRIPRAIREQQMLDSAIRVFSDLGYRSASMDLIAGDAQISKPMLYLYYGSKEDLFSACVTRESGRLIEHLTAAATGPMGSRVRLQSVVEAFLEFVDDHTDSWNVVYRQASAEPAFSEEVERTRTVLIDLTTDLLEHSAHERQERVTLEVIATALVGAGEAIADRIAHRAVDRSVAASVVVELAWRGLAGDPDRTPGTPGPSGTPDPGPSDPGQSDAPSTPDEETP